jgi:hypothetical protein
MSEVSTVNETRVLLVGGPSGLGGAARIQQVADLREEVKVNLGNGYEHFCYLGRRAQHGREMLPVFGWIGKTKIAE